MATKKKSSAKKAEPVRSFKRSPNEPFYVFRFTQQTMYWIVITLLILAIGVWVLWLTARVQNIYDDVHVKNTDASYIPMKRH